MHGVQTSTPEAGPSTPLPTAGQPELGLRPRLLDQVRDSLRRRRYSLRTEKVYIHWIRRFILFHGKRHPREMGVDEIIAFLNHLARAGRVSASTQNQALSALLYLYRQVLTVRLPWLDGVERAKTTRRIPSVLTVEQVQSVLARLEGSRWLMVSLMYGAGLRLMECLSLRVKDLGFGVRLISVQEVTVHARPQSEHWRGVRSAPSRKCLSGNEFLLVLQSAVERLFVGSISAGGACFRRGL